MIMKEFYLLDNDEYIVLAADNQVDLVEKWDCGNIIPEWNRPYNASDFQEAFRSVLLVLPSHSGIWTNEKYR